MVDLWNLSLGEMDVWSFASASSRLGNRVWFAGVMQAFVALPAQPSAIWHYPGFPSLLVTYSVSNDYFFTSFPATPPLPS